MNILLQPSQVQAAAEGLSNYGGVIVGYVISETVRAPCERHIEIRRVYGNTGYGFLVITRKPMFTELSLTDTKRGWWNERTELIAK